MTKYVVAAVLCLCLSVGARADYTSPGLSPKAKPATPDFGGARIVSPERQKMEKRQYKDKIKKLRRRGLWS
jgi:hypothetical protein